MDCIKRGCCEGFEYCFCGWDQDSDEYWNTFGQYNDGDMKSDNQDLMFYLATPSGRLVVDRNGNQNYGELSEAVLGVGFARDEGKFSPYPPDHKAELKWGNIRGAKNLKDLEPDEDDPSGFPNSNQPRRSNELHYFDATPPWIIHYKKSDGQKVDQ